MKKTIFGILLGTLLSLSAFFPAFAQSMSKEEQKQLAVYECGLHGRKVVTAWRNGYNITGSMQALRAALIAENGAQKGEKIFTVYEAMTAETIAWTEAAMARAFAGFTAAEKLSDVDTQNFAARLKNDPQQTAIWIERFFQNGWLAQPSSGYGKDFPEASWLYRMKTVQAVCAGAFVGAGDIVQGHEGLNYPGNRTFPTLQVPFSVR